MTVLLKRINLLVAKLPLLILYIYKAMFIFSRDLRHKKHHRIHYSTANGRKLPKLHIRVSRTNTTLHEIYIDSGFTNRTCLSYHLREN